MVTSNAANNCSNGCLPNSDTYIQTARELPIIIAGLYYWVNYYITNNIPLYGKCTVVKKKV